MIVSDKEQRRTELRQRVRKSNVRIVVTYFVVFMYCTTAVILTFVLLYMDQIELAVGVFSGLSTLSAGIAGFWFGNRSSGHPEELETPGSESKAELSNNLINADRASRRPLAEPEIDSKDAGEVFIKSSPKGSAK